jgi:hypothetical protein
MLAPLYARFAAEAETPDLREAYAIVNQLAERGG